MIARTALLRLIRAVVQEQEITMGFPALMLVLTFTASPPFEKLCLNFYIYEMNFKKRDGAHCREMAGGSP
jgi:hypothetical protein